MWHGDAGARGAPRGRRASRRARPGQVGRGARRRGSRSSSASTTPAWPPKTSPPATPVTCTAPPSRTGEPVTRRQAGDAPSLRLYNPDIEADGWESRHTVVELVCDDRPFLVDSVTMALNRHGWGIHLRRPPHLGRASANPTASSSGVGGHDERVVDPPRGGPPGRSGTCRRHAHRAARRARRRPVGRGGLAGDG